MLCQQVKIKILNKTIFVTTTTIHTKIRWKQWRNKTSWIKKIWTKITLKLAKKLRGI